MNTLILLMLFLVLFELLDLPACYDNANVLCFLSGLSFGCFVAGLKKNRNLTRQLSNDLNFFIQNYNNIVSQ